ncbi:export associated protein [Streptomyces sp. ICN441]|uniref:Export associated protein n=1 Tax=Streptomyces tirandamycinicus TaxID=2174846 RepID=A0A2S1SN86_9ACTN|nr:MULTISPECIES: TerD family protein [Streptomyces]AWI27869.1 export associated protein [Streptomyces tirandamycinicus]TFE57745.1 export associated protein [Streptomyces sp. ICN441]
MTAELVRGQNHPLPHTRLDIGVSAGRPVVAAVTLSDEDGRVPGTEWVAHPAQPALPGVEVSRQATADHLLAVDLNAVPASVHRVTVLLALPMGPGCPVRFGAVAAPFVSVGAPDGPETASYTVTGLDSESAVVAMEFYRRQGGWKVRAVGQGYAGGLAACLADQGLDRAGELAAVVHEAVAPGLSRTVGTPPPRTAEVRRNAAAAATTGDPGPCADHGPALGTTSDTGPRPVDPANPQPPAGTHGGPVDYTHPRRQSAAPPPPPAVPPAAPGRPPVPVAGDATGWSMEERLYNQVWGMFEDLARTTAAYRSAVDFADSRLDQELDRALSDPHSRIAGTAGGAREAARARHGELTGRAREVLDRDLDQLTAESEVVEPALPPAFARWDSPVWQSYRVPTEMPMALRLGDLHLPERPGLRIPMLVRLPLERGLWVDSGRSAPESAVVPDGTRLRALAMDTAVAHATRLLAVHPAGEFTVRVIDPAGAAARSLTPLVRSGVLDEPPAAGAGGVSAVLAKLTQRVDLVQMAVRGGAADALPPDLDTARQLLVVNDFPHGFDDRAVTQLRYLADEGPAVGVHLLMVADREDASAYGPVLDPLWRSLLRITPVPDDHLADPWVQHLWTYEPPAVPEGRDVLGPVLARVAEARRTWRR